MKLVTIDVQLDDKLEYPEQKLDEGEAIVKRVVELKSLYKELKGLCRLSFDSVFFGTRADLASPYRIREEGQDCNADNPLASY